MNILMLAVNDPAGTAIQFCKALNSHTGHTARLVTLETRYNHGWEKDLHIPDLGPDGLEEVELLLRTSDVFHFHMTADEHLAFGPHLPRDHMAGKAVVHHHHGHPDFRGHPEKYQEKYAALNRRNLLVSTPDLLRMLPGARWQPNLVPQDEPLFTPAGNYSPVGEPLKVCHAPTRKDLKNTDDLLAALDLLAEEGVPTRLEMIDNAPTTECLGRKRKCDVLFDHMQGYFGVSSLEGLSQGLAVIAGLDPWTLSRLEEAAGTSDLPWIPARDRGELVARLRELHLDRDLLAARGAAGRRFMETRWSDRRLVSMLDEFYRGL